MLWVPTVSLFIESVISDPARSAYKKVILYILGIAVSSLYYPC